MLHMPRIGFMQFFHTVQFSSVRGSGTLVTDPSLVATLSMTVGGFLWEVPTEVLLCIGRPVLYSPPSVGSSAEIVYG